MYTEMVRDKGIPNHRSETQNKQILLSSHYHNLYITRLADHDV